MAFTSTNPATGEEIARYEEFSAAEVADRLGRAATAFARYGATPLVERTEGLRRAADALEAGAPRWAKLITTEMGKPIAEARAEIEKCAAVCRYYAERSEDFLRPEPVECDAARSYVAFDPLGAVLAVMPWNYPFWQVFRFVAPALAAGNVVLLKHAANVTGCALAIEELLTSAGFDGDEFQTLLVSPSALPGIIADSRIRGVTLTGGEAAGRAIGAAAGSSIKRSVLELGGSDAFIVLADADVERAAEVGVRARFLNAGQSCIAAKRFILERPIAPVFIDRFVHHAHKLTVGDPLAESTEVGPLARKDLRDTVHDQVHRALAGGATLLTGGEPLKAPGFFYPPTVLAEVAPGSVAFEEEIFGPVAPMIVAEDSDHAVELANESRFGLGAALWTADRDGSEMIVRKLEAGSVFVNGMVRSDPRLPFGGVKASGFGRELSRFGLREFVNIKTVWIA